MERDEAEATEDRDVLQTLLARLSRPLPRNQRSTRSAWEQERVLPHSGASVEAARRAESADILADRRPGIEHRCPRNSDRHPGVRERADVLRLHAAVDLDLDVLEAAPHEFRPEPGDLADRPGNERLSAEAGIDRHEESDVDVGQDLFECGDGRRGVDSNPWLRGEAADRV